MMNPAHASVPPITGRPPRFDLFGPIHKAMRLAMGEMLTRIGATRFQDETAVRALASDLRRHLTWGELHLLLEDRFIKPAAVVRLPGGIGAFDAHVEHLQAFAELRALLDAVESGPAATRAATGRTLYLHFSAFVGESLVHMAAEERIVQPLLERFFDDAELRAVHAQILAATSPEDKALTASYLMRAFDPDERAELLARLEEVSP